jgi:hypothetical protein
MKDELDIRLEALLAPPERGPDEAFLAHLQRAVLVEERLRAARRNAWTRFATEMIAAAAALLAFWLLARASPPESDGLVTLFSPAATALLLLALWVGVSLKPSGRGLSRH